MTRLIVKETLATSINSVTAIHGRCHSIKKGLSMLLRFHFLMFTFVFLGGVFSEDGLPTVHWETIQFGFHERHESHWAGFIQAASAGYSYHDSVGNPLGDATDLLGGDPPDFVITDGGLEVEWVVPVDEVTIQHVAAHSPFIGGTGAGSVNVIVFLSNGEEVTLGAGDEWSADRALHHLAESVYVTKLKGSASLTATKEAHNAGGGLAVDLGMLPRIRIQLPLVVDGSERVAQVQYFLDPTLDFLTGTLSLDEISLDSLEPSDADVPSNFINAFWSIEGDEEFVASSSTAGHINLVGPRWYGFDEDGMDCNREAGYLPQFTASVNGVAITPIFPDDFTGPRQNVGVTWVSGTNNAVGSYPRLLNIFNNPDISVVRMFRISGWQEFSFMRFTFRIPVLEFGFVVTDAVAGELPSQMPNPSTVVTVSMTPDNQYYEAIYLEEHYHESLFLNEAHTSQMYAPIWRDAVESIAEEISQHAAQFWQAEWNFYQSRNEAIHWATNVWMNSCLAIDDVLELRMKSLTCEDEKETKEWVASQIDGGYIYGARLACAYKYCRHLIPEEDGWTTPEGIAFIGYQTFLAGLQQ